MQRDWVTQLSANTQVYFDVLEPMIDWLCAGQSPSVLDAGCGRGEPALLFAAQGCQVVGVDVNAVSLKHAADLISHTPYAKKIELRQADMTHLPDVDNTYDLVWANWALHHVADKAAAVEELKRVLKPGGRLAIREGGLPLQCLPFDIGLGQPGLQDRLRGADQRWFAAMTKATMPDERPYPYGWSQLLHDAGFEQIEARTFTTDALSPFAPAQAAFVTSHLERSLERDRGPYGPLLKREDRRTVINLLDPASPHYILARRDLHLRFGLGVYVGEKSKLNRQIFLQRLEEEEAGLKE